MTAARGRSVDTSADLQANQALGAWQSKGSSSLDDTNLAKSSKRVAMNG